MSTNSETNVVNVHNMHGSYRSQLVRAKPFGYLQGLTKELNLWPPETNSVRNSMESLNPGPLDSKASANSATVPLANCT